jgi:carbon monoxide dehydrogenase subunit G
MDVSGDYTFDAPQEAVWAALNDPIVLGSVMPGGQGFEEVEQNKYNGSLKVKVGPVQGVFDTNITLSDIVPPKSYTIEADGKGNQGNVKAKGSLKLTTENNKTHMEYTGSARVSGRIASVGQRLIESTARSIIRQSLEGLNEYLELQVKASDGSDNENSHETSDESSIAAARAYRPPSQTQVALTVMRDVFSDTIAPRMQPLLIIGVLTIILLLIWILLT